MPNVALIVVDKVFSGKKFSNTYALQHGPFTATPLNNANLVAFIGLDVFAFTGDNTDPSDPLWIGADSPVARILAFDRLMTAASVGYTRVYLSDGKTPGEPTGAFATFPLSFGGLALTSTGPEDVAPLNIALQINRVPIGFSQRQGRIQMRAALAKQEIEPFTDDGVSLKPSTADDVQARLVNAMSNSLIKTNTMLPGADADQPYIVIPKFRPKGHAEEGAIFGATPVSDFTISDAIGRQTKRGRKEKASAPTP